MKLYSIRNWDQIYENNRTRELKNLLWIAVPINHDGDGYTMLICRPNGAALFGAWIALIQVAGRCDPRGTLLRRCGNPHNPESLERITRIKGAIFAEMLSVCEKDCKWIESIDLLNPAPSCGIPAPSCVGGREGIQGVQGGEPPALPATKPGPELKQFTEKLRTARVLNLWARWMTHRRAFKKPKCWVEMFNDQIDFLEQFTEEGAFNSLQISLMNGYRGLFPPKNYANGTKNNGANPPQRVDRNIGTTNEGRASQYKGMGRVAPPSDVQRPAA